MWYYSLKQGSDTWSLTITVFAMSWTNVTSPPEVSNPICETKLFRVHTARKRVQLPDQRAIPNSFRWFLGKMRKSKSPRACTGIQCFSQERFCSRIVFLASKYVTLHITANMVGWFHLHARITAVYTRDSTVPIRRSSRLREPVFSDSSSHATFAFRHSG